MNQLEASSRQTPDLVFSITVHVGEREAVDRRVPEERELNEQRQRRIDYCNYPPSGDGGVVLQVEQRSAQTITIRARSSIDDMQANSVKSLAERKAQSSVPLSRSKPGNLAERIWQNRARPRQPPSHPRPRAYSRMA